MRRLRELTARLGHETSGTDAADGGHNADAAVKSELVVYSAAVDENNVELLAARRAGIPTVDRGRYLAAIADGYDRVIAVAGSHGKTTATAMLAAAFASKKPTVHLGGELVSPPKEESGAFFITEACEYRRSLLDLSPDVGVVLNAELDHTDCYRSVDEVREVFARFGERSDLTVYNADDAGLALVMPRKNSVTFGLNECADFRASGFTEENGRQSFDLSIKGVYLGRLSYRAVGRHNVYNSLAAAACALTEGLPFSLVAEGLYGYAGVKRRAEFLGRVNGALVYADYAHHPTQIRALVEAFRGNGKLIIAFEPHTYSRTRDLFNEFVSCFDGADELMLLPVYGARESSGEVNSSDLFAEVKKRVNAEYFARYDDLDKALAARLYGGETVVFAGAGSIYDAANAFVRGHGVADKKE